MLKINLSCLLGFKRATLNESQFKTVIYLMGFDEAAHFTWSEISYVSFSTLSSQLYSDWLPVANARTEEQVGLKWLYDRYLLFLTSY